MSEIKIALAQLRCSLYEKEENLIRMLHSIERTSEKEVDYIVFPELFLTGYVIDDKIYELAETDTGSSIQQLQVAAKMYRIGVIVGFAERDGDQLFNTALIIGKKGQILGKYRKVHLYYREKEIFSAGNSLPIFDLPEGKVGIGITYDMEFPETVRTIALQHAQLFIVLAANMIPYQEFQNVFIKARALENHIYAVISNMVGLDSENIFFGESQIVHPSGKTLYKATNNEEIPIFSLDLNETIPEMERLDYLHNRNIQAYKL